MESFSLAPVLAAPALVQVHLAAGLAALATGAARVGLSRSERAGRLLGWAFVILIAVAAASALGLSRPPGTPNLFGVTLGHLFVAATAVGVAAALRAARSRDRLGWGNIVTALFAGVLITCGLFELLPGRLLNTVLAGG